MSAGAWVYIDVEKIVAETEKAFLLLVDGAEAWVPKACVSDPGDYCAGEEHVEMGVLESFAREKGLSYE